MFILAAIRCWLYKLSHYEYSYGSSIKYNKLTEYTYNYVKSTQYDEFQTQHNYNYGDINNG